MWIVGFVDPHIVALTVKEAAGYSVLHSSDRPNVETWDPQMRYSATPQIYDRWKIHDRWLYDRRSLTLRSTIDDPWLYDRRSPTLRSMNLRSTIVINVLGSRFAIDEVLRSFRFTIYDPRSIVTIVSINRDRRSWIRSSGSISAKRCRLKIFDRRRRFYWRQVPPFEKFWPPKASPSARNVTV